MLMHTRKGHIPTFLLIVEGIILMIVAGFAFVGEKGDLDSVSRPISETLQEITYWEDYVHSVSRQLVAAALRDSPDDASFEDSFSTLLEQRAVEVDEVANASSNLFGYIRNHNYTITSVGENYTLRMDDVQVWSQSGAHSLTRVVDISVIFNRTSVIS